MSGAVCQHLGASLRRIAILLPIALLSPTAGSAETTPPSGVPPSSSDPIAQTVREVVYPALVNLTVVRERFSDGRTRRFPGVGSGVIVTPEGHVVTNYHVAGDATRITATLNDGRVLEAEVVTHDPLSDLSILELESPGNGDLPTAEFGDSDRLAVGDTVFALGNPLALSSSLTRGIVSNPARVFTDFTRSEMQHLQLGEGEMSGLFTRWIQHDAIILPGNSGGPLVDAAGRVVGINELGGGGIGFAIPSNIARRILDQVLEEGEVTRGWLGFSVLPVKKLGRTTGALVSDVLPDSPATEAGLEAGDVLTAIDGEPVSVRFFEEVPLLYQRIAALPIGADVKLTVDRDGETVILETEVEKMEPFTGEEDEVRRLGMTVQEITGPMAIFRQLSTTEGLLVTGIRPGAPADSAKPALATEDVVVEIAGHPVPRSIEAFRKLVADLPRETDLLVRLQRDGEELLAVVPPLSETDVAWGGELPEAWVGLRTQVLTEELAAVLSATEDGGPDLLPEGVDGGFRITRVLPWTGASDAGFEPGDVIVALDGEPIEASRLQDAEGLRRRIEEYPVSERVTFTVVRDRERLEIVTELEERPTEPEDLPTVVQEELDFTVRELAFQDRIENRWDREVEGVVVADAARGGWAQMAGLRLGDLVIEIDDRAVPDLETFRDVMEGVLERRPSVMPIFVRRGFRTHFVLLEPDWGEVFPGESIEPTETREETS